MGSCQWWATTAEQHTVPVTQWVLSTPGQDKAGVTEMHPKIGLPVPCNRGQAEGH